MAQCPEHPGTPAVYQCTDCRRGLCIVCDAKRGRGGLCAACQERRGVSPAAIPIDTASRLAVAEPQQVKEAPASLSCPQCRQLDAVRKVSMVFSEGTGTSVGLGLAAGAIFGQNRASPVGGLGIGVQRSQTGLSKRLAPPSRTGPKAGRAESLGCLTIWLAMFFVVLMLAEMGRNNAPLGWAYFLLAGVFGWVAYQFSQGFKEKRRSFASRWQQAVKVWDASYYCARCDGIFLPGQSSVQRPEDAWKL